MPQECIEPIRVLYVFFHLSLCKNFDRPVVSKAEKRNADLLRALRQQSGVTEANVKVVTAPAGALARHKGKAMYKVTVDVQ